MSFWLSLGNIFITLLNIFLLIILIRHFSFLWFTARKTLQQQAEYISKRVVERMLDNQDEKDKGKGEF